MDPNRETAIQQDDTDFVALQVGATVGRYEIVATLGQGGFGITYRARDTRLGRDVAIKEYLPSALAIRHEGASVMPRSTKVAGDFTWGRDRFIAEGQTLATLQRAPAIVRVFDYIETNGTAYIVMELVSGKTLEDQLKRDSHLLPGTVDRILQPLLDGLEQVHDAGFLHRDIKPANILLDADGNPTLIDFGAARAAIAGHTVAMTAIFTPGYAAAEQFTSGRQGPWTDIYGLSATLYHAIAGHPAPSAFERMLDDGYEPLTKFLPADFSLKMLAGIDAGLALRANDRPQSIAGWRAVISQVAARGDAAVTIVQGGRPDPATTVMMPRASTVAPLLESALVRSAKRRTGLWVGAATVALILAGSGYYVAISSLPKSTTSPMAPTEAKQTQEARTAINSGHATGTMTVVVPPGTVAQSLSPANAFDGIWDVTETCPPHASAQGFTRVYAITVKNGDLVGYRGVDGQPDSLTVRGTIEADGTAVVNVRGLTADAASNVGNAPAGSLFRYRFTAHFDGNHGTGTRSQYRPCSYALEKH